MNTLILILALIVGLCYFGEKYCPAVLKQNKQILLGVLIGLGSASFMGVGIEGLNENMQLLNECCVNNPDLSNPDFSPGGKCFAEGQEQTIQMADFCKAVENTRTVEMATRMKTRENEGIEIRRLDNLRESGLSGVNVSDGLLDRLANTGN